MKTTARTRDWRGVKAWRPRKPKDPRKAPPHRRKPVKPKRPTRNRFYDSGLRDADGREFTVRYRSPARPIGPDRTVGAFFLQRDARLVARLLNQHLKQTGKP